MHDDNPDSGLSEQNPPSKEELQQRARYVWRVLKFFFSGLFLVSAIVLGFLFYWLFHTFGIGGMIVGAIALLAGLVLLCRHLLTY